MDTDALEKIGLTKGESKVYMALLKTGASSAGPLVKESGVSRSKIYEITERLIAKGLVSSVIENGVKNFRAANPKLIPDYLEREKLQIEKQKEEFLKALPLLLARVKEKEAEQSVEVFEGWPGIKNIFIQLIKEARRNDEWYAFGIPKISKERASFFVSWRRKTDKIGVVQKLIANEEIRDSLELAPRSKFSNIRYTNQKTPTSVDVFKDYTLLGVWTEKPIIVVIKSNAVAESFKNYFDSMWKTAKQ